MSATLDLRHQAGEWVEVATPQGQVLWRYVYQPRAPANESPRPYAHPVYSKHGDVLTNFRPNDHPWHHGLSLTLTRVDGVNFWGGPSYRSGDGYQWRDEHGRQVHQGWSALTPQLLRQDVTWQHGDRALLREARTLETTVGAHAWSLCWTSELENVSGRELALGNYHSDDGLAGSHYTGLQFRGARDLLDEHGDATIGIRAEGGRSGETVVHGAEARWMEWSCQHDGSLRRTRIRFENPDGPLPWFVRAKNPLAAFAFHRERPQRLTAGATLLLHHVLTFANA